jgi:hypothetical protein
MIILPDGGPGTAMPFAFALAEILAGAIVADKVRSDMLL